MSKIIRLELTKSDMEAAVKAYIQPKINEALQEEIAKGVSIKVTHRYLTASVAEVSVELESA